MCNFKLFVIFLNIILLQSITADTGNDIISRCAENFVSSTLNLSLKTTKIHNRIRFSPIGLPHKRLSLGENYSAYVSISDCTVYRLSNPGGYQTDSKIPLTPIENKISKETAFNVIKPILSALELSCLITDFEIDLFNINGRDIEKDLTGAFWRFHLGFQKNKIQCRTRGISFSVNASSGEFSSYLFKPIILPNYNLEQNFKNFLNKEEIIDIACGWLKTHAYFKDASPQLSSKENERQLVIAPDFNNYNLDSEYIIKKKNSITNTYYCWEETFTWKEKWIDKPGKGKIWIDIRNGNIIGAL
jgi:hypothetical protein